MYSHDVNYTRAALLHDIPEVVSPDLLEALAAMGRGDKIVLANLNFPAASTCRGPERPLLVRADGHRTADLLEAIVKLLPVENEVFTDFYIILLLQTKTTQTQGVSVRHFRYNTGQVAQNAQAQSCSSNPLAILVPCSCSVFSLLMLQHCQAWVLEKQDDYCSCPADDPDCCDDGDAERNFDDTPVLNKYKQILDDEIPAGVSLNKLSWTAFKKKAEESYVVVATGEPSPHGAIILESGVVSLGGDDYSEPDAYN